MLAFAFPPSVRMEQQTADKENSSSAEAAFRREGLHRHSESSQKRRPPDSEQRIGWPPVVRMDQQPAGEEVSRSAETAFRSGGPHRRTESSHLLSAKHEPSDSEQKIVWPPVRMDEQPAYEEVSRSAETAFRSGGPHRRTESSHLLSAKREPSDSEQRIVWPPVRMDERPADEEASRSAETAVRSEGLHRHTESSHKRKPADSERRIVWPPVVIIENSRTHFDTERNQWTGLGNEEIRQFLLKFGDIQFRVFALYGPNGHRGRSIAVFPATPSGYMDAHTLTEMLAHHHRGYRHWIDVSRDRDPVGPGKVTADGKKILYGYLACEQDMNEVDRFKKLVKRWSMESYAEKVLQPLDRCERETEEARKKRAKLSKEAHEKLRVVEHSKEIVGMHAAQFREISEKIEGQKKQEEKLEALHKEKFEELKRQHEQEKQNKLQSFKDRERSIRQQLEQTHNTKQTVMAKYEALAQRLKDGIDMEKRNHDLRIAEQEKKKFMDNVNLQSEMEEKLAQLEKKFQDKQLKLQEQHNEQIIKFREKLNMEKETFLEEKFKELKNIEMESQEAKTSTQREIERECIICFADMVDENKERALFSCGHANVCSKCAKDFWMDNLRKKIKPFCPTCKVVQPKKYSLIPAKIYK